LKCKFEVVVGPCIACYLNTLRTGLRYIRTLILA